MLYHCTQPLQHFQINFFRNWMILNWDSPTKTRKLFTTGKDAAVEKWRRSVAARCEICTSVHAHFSVVWFALFIGPRNSGDLTVLPLSKKKTRSALFLSNNYQTCWKTCDYRAGVGEKERRKIFDFHILVTTLRHLLSVWWKRLQ